MELLQVQSSVPCGQICPCVNQAQPCYCEERAGYSSLSYDFPLTIDTNIEYELKDLHSDINRTGTDGSSCPNALLIDYNSMAETGHMMPCEPQQPYWVYHPETIPCLPPAESQCNDLYQMIETLNADAQTDFHGTGTGAIGPTPSIPDYNAINTYQACGYPNHLQQTEAPFGAAMDNNYYCVPEQKPNHNKWFMEKDLSSCAFPHNSTGSTASSTTSNYQALCRGY